MVCAAHSAMAQACAQPAEGPGIREVVEKRAIPPANPATDFDSWLGQSQIDLLHCLYLAFGMREASLSQLTGESMSEGEGPKHVSIVATGGGQPSFAIEAPINQVSVKPDLKTVSLDFHTDEGGAIIDLDETMARKLLDELSQAIPKIGEEDDLSAFEVDDPE